MKCGFLVLLAATLTLCVAAPAHALRYMAFLSAEGYREIQLAPGLYFVAFHAQTGGDINEIDAAWRTRAAQLCSASGSNYFIQVKYSFEPVLKSDPQVLSLNWSNPAARPILTKGTYVPIFIPTQHGPQAIEAPGKQAHVRCVKDPSAALDPTRLMDATKILQEGKARGWVGPTEK